MRCSMSCGPFVPAEVADGLHRAMDWQTPLLLATLPLAVVVAWWLLRLVVSRKRLPAV